MLLDVAELLEPSLAVGTLVRFLTGVHAYVLDQLVVGAERLETLLALVRFAHLQAAAAQRTAAYAAGPSEVPRLHLHGRRLLHEYLQHKRNAVSMAGAPGGGDDDGHAHRDGHHRVDGDDRHCSGGCDDLGDRDDGSRRRESRRRTVAAIATAASACICRLQSSSSRRLQRYTTTTSNTTATTTDRRSLPLALTYCRYTSGVAHADEAGSGQ